MPRGPKKRKTGKGKTATSKKIIIEHAAEANCSKSLGIHGGAVYTQSSSISNGLLVHFSRYL